MKATPDYMTVRFKLLRGKLATRPPKMKFHLSITSKEAGYFFDKNVEKAEYYRHRFEGLYEGADEQSLNLYNGIPIPYSTGAAYYFKMGNNKKAKEILKKGLEYVPDDYMLKSRLNALN